MRDDIGKSEVEVEVRKNPEPRSLDAPHRNSCRLDDPYRHRTRAKRFLNTLRIMTGGEDDFRDEDRKHEHRLSDVSEGLGNGPFYWITALQNSFRKEFEK